MTAARIREYAQPALLRDGGSVLVRALRATDRSLLLGLFGRLSLDSVRHRAFGIKNGLSEKELAYLTDLDFVKHVGLAALLVEDGEEHMIGVGRYIRIPPRGSAVAPAEVAFSVVDEHQGRGVGTVLLEHLARIAEAEGVDELEADVMADNHGMMGVFTKSGFVVRHSFEDAIYHVTFPTSETAAFVRASIVRERHAAAESVRVFFEPRSVAVIGPGRGEGPANTVLASLRRAAFKGPVYAIDPEGTSGDGVEAFPDLAAVSSPIDLAVVAVPASRVEQVTLACAAAGVRGVVVLSSGDDASASDGRAVRDRLRRLVRTSGMRLLGPGSLGVIDTAAAVSLNATVAPSAPRSGNVSVLCQDAALGNAILDDAGKHGFGIAKFAGAGSKADVSGNDVLSYWAGDDATRVIALCIESIGNPVTFARIAPEVARSKPVVALMSGVPVPGIAALLASSGVLQTSTLDELFDVVALLATQPLPGGTRVGMITNSRGAGMLLAEACEARGLSLPMPSPGTREQLRRILPPQEGRGDPVGLIASATPEHYAGAITTMANDANVDALVVIYVPLLGAPCAPTAAAIASAAGDVPAHKPILTVFMASSGTPHGLALGPRGPIPCYGFPEDAARALTAAVRYARWQKRPPGEELPPDARVRIAPR